MITFAVKAWKEKRSMQLALFYFFWFSPLIIWHNKKLIVMKGKWESLLENRKILWDFLTFYWVLKRVFFLSFFLNWLEGKLWLIDMEICLFFLEWSFRKGWNGWEEILMVFEGVLKKLEKFLENLVKFWKIWEEFLNNWGKIQKNWEKTQKNS